MWRLYVEGEIRPSKPSRALRPQRTQSQRFGSSTVTGSRSCWTLTALIAVLVALATEPVVASILPATHPPEDEQICATTLFAVEDLLPSSCGLLPRAGEMLSPSGGEVTILQVPIQLLAVEFGMTAPCPSGSGGGGASVVIAILSVDIRLPELPLVGQRFIDGRLDVAPGHPLDLLRPA